MNTARELLLARHRPVARRVEAARRRVLLERLPPSELLWWRLAAEELFAPQRTAWAALAALWILILGFHLATAPSRGPVGPAALADNVMASSDRALFAQLGLPNPEGPLSQ